MSTQHIGDELEDETQTTEQVEETEQRKLPNEYN